VHDDWHRQRCIFAHMPRYARNDDFGKSQSGLVGQREAVETSRPAPACGARAKLRRAVSSRLATSDIDEIGARFIRQKLASENPASHVRRQHVDEMVGLCGGLDEAVGVIVSAKPSITRACG